MTTRYRSIFAPQLFAGKVIVITGGGSGIGRCTAHELAALGAHDRHAIGVAKEAVDRMG